MNLVSTPSQDGLKLEIPNDQLNAIWHMIRNPDDMKVEGLELTKENIKALSIQMPKPFEKVSNDLLTFRIDLANFDVLFKLITAHFVESENNLLPDFDSRLIKKLKESVDSIFHELKGNNVSKNDQERIREIINSHRKMLNDLNKI